MIVSAYCDIPSRIPVQHSFPTAMSSFQAHFLSLPREIRDGVYDYLHQQVTFDLTFRFTRHRVVVNSARFENAPLRSVLLVCRQIYNEYRQSSCFRNLSIFIFLNSVSGSLCRQAPKNINNGVDFNRAILLLRSVTIFVYNWLKPTHRWDQTTQYIQGLKSKAARLSSVRLAFYQHIDTYEERELASAINLSSLIRDMEPHLSAPFMLAGFPMYQISEGFRTDYAWGLSWPDISFRLYRIGSCLYTEESAPKHWWQKNEAFETCQTTELPQGVLKSMPERKAEIRKQSMHQTQEWQERRGREVLTWPGSISGLDRDLDLQNGENSHAQWFPQFFGNVD